MSDIGGSIDESLQQRIEAAVDDRVSAALRTLERRVQELEGRTRAQLRDMLGTVAKQKVAIDSAIDKISKNGGPMGSSPVFGDEVVARLERAERAAGIFPDNRLDLYDRLSALESRMGLYQPVGVTAWGSPGSASKATRNGRPVSALRAFMGDGYKFSTFQGGSGNDFERVQTAPQMMPRPPMSAERPSRPMSTPTAANRTTNNMFSVGFEGTQLATTKEISDMEFSSTFGGNNSPDGNQIVPAESSSNNSNNIPTEGVMNTLAEMNKIIRSEQDAKSEYQMRITELSFALEEKRIREEEARGKIANLEDLTRELHARQELLQDQKETVEATLKTAKEQLRRVQDVSDRKNNSKVKVLQQQIDEMNNSLQQAKSLNAEYETSLKRLANQRRDEEDAKRIALEERDYLESSLRKAKADLDKHRRAQEEAEEHQRAALRRAEEEAEHHRRTHMELEKQQALVKKSKEDLEKEYKSKTAQFEEQQAAFKKMEEELLRQKQMYIELQKQQAVQAQSASEQHSAQMDQRQDELLQEKERLEKQVQAQNELQQRHQAALRRAKEELENQRKTQQELERQIALLKGDGSSLSQQNQSTLPSPLRRASSAVVSSSRTSPQRPAFSPINEEEDATTPSPPSQIRRASSANSSPSSSSPAITLPSVRSGSPLTKGSSPSSVGGGDAGVSTSSKAESGSSGAASQIEVLKAELLKEMALLKEVDTMREGLKEEIKIWMDNFSARNGRAPTVEERAPVAPRYQAYKEAGELRERVVNKINEIKAKGREATLAARGTTAT